MSKIKWISILALMLSFSMSHAGHIRGMSIVNDRQVWFSGSQGTVLRTTNSGKSFDTLNPKGYANKDFRDIHAWDKNNAIVMSAGDSTVFLSTSNGGKTWSKVYENNSPGIFFDAFDIHGHEGAAVSDPILIKSVSGVQRAFVVVFTHDRGKSWNYTSQIPFFPVLAIDTLEAAFAASGSIIQVISKSLPIEQRTYFVTGGNKPRILRCDLDYNVFLPLKSGDGFGAYSMFLDEMRNGIVVGGKWNAPNLRDSVACFSEDGGRDWKPCETMPMGYRSCVTGRSGRKVWACTGTNGTDISQDYGKNWKSSTLPGFNVCGFSNKSLWLAGNNGKWQRVKISKLTEVSGQI